MLVTTKWGHVGSRSDVGEVVVKSLVEDDVRWEVMARQGCRVTKYLNTRESACDVIKQIEGREHPLQVQMEMATGTSLRGTTVGLHLYGSS